MPERERPLSVAPVPLGSVVCKAGTLVSSDIGGVRQCDQSDGLLFSDHHVGGLDNRGRLVTGAASPIGAAPEDFEPCERVRPLAIFLPMSTLCHGDAQPMIRKDGRQVKFAGHSANGNFWRPSKNDRFARDSPLEQRGFELMVPP